MTEKSVYTALCLSSLLVIRALIYPSSRSQRGPPLPRSETDADYAQLVDTCKNLLSIANLLQSDLYSTEWFDGAAVELCSQSRTLLASRSIRAGEIVTLFPVHAVGLRPNNATNGETESLGEWLWKDEDRDYFRRPERSTQQRVTFSELEDDPFWKRAVLSVDVNLDRPPRRGWWGHLAEQPTSHDKGNCGVVLLSFPVAALVATRSIPAGRRVVRTDQPNPKLRRKAADRVRGLYAKEVSELTSFLQMGYKQQVPEPRNAAMGTFRYPFHCINRKHPGVSMLHTDPDIVLVEEFLTDDECDKIVEKARNHLVPSLVKNEKTGAVEQDSTRTSSNTNIPQREIPSVVNKIMALSNCTQDQLEIVQVLQYNRGQYFLPHTDGFQGPTTACGFETSGRLVTVFCYLNDVQSGGESSFPLLNLSIAPRKGAAVVHFPTTTGFEEDLRTEHEGSVADDEKWLLATWVWKDPRTDAAYGEEKLPPLSEDVI